MSVLINIPDRPLDKLLAKMQKAIPSQEIQVWPNVPDPESVEFALVWKHQAGSLLPFNNLKGISSFGAGVDSILSDPQLPQVPIARIVDPMLATNMARFVLTQIQHHKLRFSQFRQQQTTAIWKPKSPRRENRVGILGLGQLGAHTAELLVHMGFEVSGWSRTKKALPNVKCESGGDGLRQVVANSDYLVCLLPLTAQTRNILNAELFELLPNGAVLINVARGEHLDENALLQALEQNQLGSAYLDVFCQEPLPVEHPFWQHPNIHITPHVSAVTNVETAVTQIIENYQRVQRGLPMLNTINNQRGY